MLGNSTSFDNIKHSFGSAFFLKQRTSEQRRRINARNRDRAQLNTFVIGPCPGQRRRAAR